MSLLTPCFLRLFYAFVLESTLVRADTKAVELLHREESRYEVGREELETREGRLGEEEEGCTSTSCSSREVRLYLLSQ